MLSLNTVKSVQSFEVVQFWPLSLCHATPALRDKERGARTGLSFEVAKS